MNDINASEDALLKFCDALLIAALDQITTEHYFNLTDKGDGTENKNFVKALSSNIVNRFILLEVPTRNSNLLYQCEHCKKNLKGLKLFVNTEN